MSGFTKTSDGTSRRTPIAVAGLAAILLSSTALSAAPAIRTSEANRVPACATPERLTAFLSERNPSFDPRYRDIARWYKYWGEAWRVRWDYAFFQMMLETNALKFRRGDGRPGDVHAKQNNFAGIGATGGGVPGDRFPDIKTGVHAQIQHLVAYSGERLAAPIAPRTQLRQDDIVDQSLRLQRAVTFGDLARRWAADRAYAKSIDALAEQFRVGYCNGVATNADPTRAVPAPRPAVRRELTDFPPPSGLGGPKPARLAGPDVLPWLNPDEQHSTVTAQAAPSSAANGTMPAVAAPSTTAHRIPPFRTIWSRDGNLTQVATTPRPAEHAGQSVSAAPEAPQPAAPDDEIPSLPHFKIAPVVPGPSRLGGPVDAMPMAPTPLAKPTAQFKSIVTAPLEQKTAAAPCRVLAASYGGKKTLLVRASIDGETRYTALTVLDGFEKSMFDIYTKVSAPGAEVVGEYESRDAALADARTNCPAG